MASRKQYDNRFKAQVAIEAIKDQRTMAQIASDYEVHPNQVSQWKRQILEERIHFAVVVSEDAVYESAFPLIPEFYQHTVDRLVFRHVSFLITNGASLKFGG